MLNISVIGAGLIGKKHIALVANSPECQLTAIADPDPRSEALALQYQSLHLNTLDEVIAQQPDGIILATPNHLHIEQALQCLEAGIPTLIEKPVAHTLAAAKTLLTASQANPTPLMVGHHRMYSPIMTTAKQIIDSGALGELVAINGSALFYKPEHYFEAGPWRTQPGGGPVLINMIHEIGNLRYLCGEITALQAMASNARRQFEVEDTVSINLQFANGAMGIFIVSDTAASARSWEQTSLENPDYAAYPEQDCYQIAGTRGSLAIPTMQLQTYQADESASWWQAFSRIEQIPLQRHDPLVMQLKHFCQVIRGETQPRVTVHDGYQNLRITEAIVTAATSGKTIHLAN